MALRALTHKFLSILKKDGCRSALSAFYLFFNQYTRKVCRALFLRPKAHIKHIVHVLQYGGAAPKRYDTIKISPQDVNTLLIPHFWSQVSPYSTHIKSGDWDKNISSENVMYYIKRAQIKEQKLIKICNYGLHTSAKHRYKRNQPWEQTEIYQWLHLNKKSLSRYHTTEQIQRGLDMLDQLYKDMGESGYKRQKELNNRSHLLNLVKTSPTFHEVTINIGRNGELIFDEGRHRFIIAKLLDLDHIYVRVLVRHEEWQSIRSEIYQSDTVCELSEKAKKHLDHPDVQSL